MTRLALFDLDHTLIPTDSDHAWGRFMIQLGLVDPVQFQRDNERFYEDYQNGCLDIHAYLRVAVAPLTRHSRDELDAWHRQFMADVIGPNLLPSARELVRAHQDAGDLCCIITATNAFVTRPIATAFGVDNLLAIELATEDGAPRGRYTGDIVGVPSFREGKVTRLHSWLADQGKTLADFSQTFFYSDSRNDLPLMQEVSDPVATNPDETLRAHAVAHGWRILELFN
ncbi:HAD family hydrolase [Robbsia sp. KACC 23696]|uniref:histidinol-phosphatase n=1 Tax=Robbsia sp. KACC 23696 TaxID=3149231 RepID=UPI00325A5A95